MTVRTRFAPSPTGYLHVGGARTALFSWLYAKKTGGKFILRIEDTDRERSTQESVDAILEGMDWLGLDYDEGPFYQTDQFDRYKEVIQQLLDTGHAYHCDCSKERLADLRERQMANKEKPRYDGCCRERCSRWTWVGGGDLNLHLNLNSNGICLVVATFFKFGTIPDTPIMNFYQVSNNR